MLEPSPSQSQPETLTTTAIPAQRDAEAAGVLDASTFNLDLSMFGARIGRAAGRGSVVTPSRQNPEAWIGGFNHSQTPSGGPIPGGFAQNPSPYHANPSTGRQLGARGTRPAGVNGDGETIQEKTVIPTRPGNTQD